MCAWTSLHNYVDKEVVTNTVLNADIKANMEFLGTSHNHSGGTSSGSAVLGPATSIAFADIGDPAAVMTMQASGTVLKIHNGGSVVSLSHPQAAATASIRTLTFVGTGAANGTHIHNIGLAGTSTLVGQPDNNGATDPVLIMTKATGSTTGIVNIVTTGTAFMIGFGFCVFSDGNSPTGTNLGTLLIDGTVKQTISTVAENRITTMQATHNYVGASGTISITCLTKRSDNGTMRSLAAGGGVVTSAAVGG